ncbi:hypothetical protein ACFLUO_03655 [Chloroflexota bacterium]
MEAKHLINVSGILCPPETDAAFNKWHEEDHIPNNMKFKGLDAATRYKLVGATDDADTEEYPDYVAIYRFKDYATFLEWNASPELQEARKNLYEVCIKGGTEMQWRAQYESIRSWQSTPPLSAINIVGVQCPPEGEVRFDAWYSEKHIPDLLKFKGLEGVIRYKLGSSVNLGAKTHREVKVKEYPKYLTFYYFKDVPTAEAYDTSPERMSVRDDWRNMQKETGAQHLWRVRYKPIRTWQR